MRKRLAPLALGLATTLNGTPEPAAAQQVYDSLPDMGSSAGVLITPREEQLYGAMTLRQIREAGVLLEDPLIESWLNGLGYALVAENERPQKDFTFFAIRSREINAFATFGGYVGVNAGLVLAAESQDEVAAVLAHEISHVTQRHILRGAEAAQKDQLPIMLGILAAAIAGASAGSGDAVEAAMVGGQALMMQRQINFTRASEQEADRIGIQLLARAGFDANAMAGFFERMQQATRTGASGVPEFLRTHPVTTNRIAEARERAARIQGEIAIPWLAVDASDDVRAQNPLLPRPLAIGLDWAWLRPDPRLFAWARERMRVLSAASPIRAVSDYEAREKAAPQDFSDADRYGLGVALMRAGRPNDAIRVLQPLLETYPDNLWVALALAEGEHKAGQYAKSDARFDALLERMPGSEAVTMTYAHALNERGTRAAGKRAQEVLRPLLNLGAYDVEFQRTFARASELAGDTLRAAEAYAEASFLSGNAEEALAQLRDLQKRDDLDYIQRARVDARIAYITPIALEMRRRQLRTPSDGGQRASLR